MQEALRRGRCRYGGQSNKTSIHNTGAIVGLFKGELAGLNGV